MRALIVLPLVAALATGGCATLGAVSQGDVPTVADIQQDVVSACGILPSAAAIAGLVATGAAAGAGLALGSEIAKIICSAVPAPKTSFAARAGRPFTVVVRGVPVEVRRVPRSYRVAR